ncbi:2-polyprenyl-6-methoxyphenol hydroxylase-like FAD-dependent oxidoreductase [Streptosporangium album]|uniref:2-polyprenyl-6-methoxyphenol hydroxylase-like FAD-dependent oxidoreductase n=1 Tax=Streptosporangium album TaxID=47479 RepID=A0A7W7RUR0_9ACTN|nr:NAD(P)/FAD-dependent oxidoreductase [Streptosporangium album]MBB4938287.1 2-polyprenyl-6-methoxyphenol hydroxylase-like FAD-dependent oxidoreductase [Streptosporangium album]
MIHVIVAGGGIGGLCLAQGLRRSGVSVTVYERDNTPDARLQGYRLNIEPVGSAALHECLPAELWETLMLTGGDPGPGMGVLDEHLNELMLERGAQAADPADSTHSLSRATLRAVLLTGLDVRFGKELVRYERTAAGKVVAHFADGDTAIGDVLVGADGVRSRVRRQLLPHAETAAAPGVGIGGRLPLTEETERWLDPRLATRKNLVLPVRDFLFTAVFRRRNKPHEAEARIAGLGLDPELLTRGAADQDYVMWAFVAHRRHYAGEPRAFVEQRIADWHPVLRRLVRESEAVERFDFTAMAKVRPWPSTNVTLLGDAIHAMPPVGGMGGNAALHDARLLCRALTDVDQGRAELVPAIAAYESEMLKAGFAAVSESMRYLWLAILPSRSVRAIARCFFRLCGLVPPLRRAVFQDE